MAFMGEENISLVANNSSETLLHWHGHDAFQLDSACTVMAYGLPVLIVIGIIGNVISLSVILSSSMRNSSTSVYLSALAIGDFLVILWTFVEWMLIYGTVNANWITHATPCKLEIVVFCRNATFSFSSWIIVAISMERFFVIRYPITSLRFCTLKNALRIVLVLIVFNVIAASVLVTMYGVNLGFCNRVAYINFQRSLLATLLHVSIFNFIPLLCVIAFSAGTMYTLQTRRKCLHRITSSNNAFRESEKANRIALVVGLTYILLTLPGGIIFVIMRLNYNVWLQSQTLMIFVSIGHLSITANHCIHFFLYVITSERFRKQIVSACVCSKRRSEVPRTNVGRVWVHHRDRTSVISAYCEPSGSDIV